MTPDARGIEAAARRFLACSSTARWDDLSLVQQSALCGGAHEIVAAYLRAVAEPEPSNRARFTTTEPLGLYQPSPARLPGDAHGGQV